MKGLPHIPCNWFQCQENSIDPVHFEWLHSNWSQVLKGEANPEYAPTHLKLGFDEFEYGFVYRRVRADTDAENGLWTVGRVCLWPNALYTTFFEWRVPIDDENTLSVAWFNNPVPGDEPFEQTCIPYRTAPIKDPETGQLDFHPHHESGFHCLGGPGHDCRPDARASGRERPRRDPDAQADAGGGPDCGQRGEPKAVIRDPQTNRQLYLPRVEHNLRNQIAQGQSKAPRNQHLAGQPQVISDEMDRIWAERRQGGRNGLNSSRRRHAMAIDRYRSGDDK